MQNATTPYSDRDTMSNSVGISGTARLSAPDPVPLPIAPGSGTDALLNQPVIFASPNPATPAKRKAKYEMIHPSLKASSTVKIND